MPLTGKIQKGKEIMPSSFWLLPGLRCTDIKRLRLDHFHWEEKKLVFTQSKTKESLSLPLTGEVGWAIIDYLKYGRPKIDQPYLFVKHIAPFGPFSEADHLHQLIKRYMELAHLPTLKKRRGMHSSGIPWPVYCLKTTPRFVLFQTSWGCRYRTQPPFI